MEEQMEDCSINFPVWLGQYKEPCGVLQLYTILVNEMTHSSPTCLRKENPKRIFLLDSVAATIQSYEARVIENLLMSLLDSVFAPFLSSCLFSQHIGKIWPFGGLYERRAHQEEKC